MSTPGSPTVARRKWYGKNCMACTCRCSRRQWISSPRCVSRQPLSVLPNTASIGSSLRRDSSLDHRFNQESKSSRRQRTRWCPERIRRAVSNATPSAQADTG
eukprot:1045342-Prorocentrum_minimum.AAC.1